MGGESEGREMSVDTGQQMTAHLADSGGVAGRIQEMLRKQH